MPFQEKLPFPHDSRKDSRPRPLPEFEECGLARDVMLDTRQANPLYSYL